VTATPRELAHAAELRSTLVELNNAAIDARRYIYSHTAGAKAAGMIEVAAESGAHLDRLDAAIADAGDLLSRVAS
jgi:hypothetical protein